MKKFLIALLVIVAVLVVIVSMQPSEFAITRSTTIAASPATVFANVNDFHQWDAWSPWAKLDPNMKATFEGPESGEGSAYSWSGNNQVGEGKMTLVQSQPSERIEIKLDFLKPMKATNTAEFKFEADGQGTKVTWTMSGRKGCIQKAFCLFMNMDKMVGGDFEKGLAQLKTISEAAPQ